MISADANLTAQIHNNHLMKFAVYPHFLTPEECEDIIHFDLPVAQGKINELAGGKARLDFRHRNALNKNIPRTEIYKWLYDRVVEQVRIANTTYFHFNLRIVSPLQLLEYQDSGFYHCHADIGSGELSQRKLSMVVPLTPSDQYEGGSLMLYPNFPEFPQDQGSAIIFPSYIPHEVKPVTSGIRHSLVAWILGACFR